MKRHLLFKAVVSIIMTMQEQFSLDIFFEHLQEAFLLPVGQDITLHAMRLFGGYDMMDAVAYATLGSLIALMVGYIIGLILKKYRYIFKAGLAEDKYQLASGYAQKFGWLLLPLWFVPFGTLLPLLAGFFGLRWWIVLVMILLGAIFHFSIVL